MAVEPPWAEVTDPSWRPAFTRVPVGLVVRFFGPCPRCHHETSAEFPLVLPGSTTVRGEDDEPFVMFCDCGHPHDSHPEGDNSCGAYWPYVDQL
jgi:hypothetical protein